MMADPAPGEPAEVTIPRGADASHHSRGEGSVSSAASRMLALWARHEAWIVPSLLSLLLLASGSLAIFSMRLDSATEDEPSHIAAGYLKLKYGYFDFYKEQPPLINSLSALPIAFGPYAIAAGWEDHTRNPRLVGRVLLYGSGNDADRILYLARLPIVGLFLLLVLLVYVWGLDITRSRTAALLGASLAAFCPNLLAHARLATVDMGATFFCALGALTFLQLLRSPTAFRAAACGASVGLAALSKVSGLILLPWALLTAAVFLVRERRRLRQALARLLPRLLLASAAALLAIEAVYLAELTPSYIRLAYPGLRTPWGHLAIPLHEYVKNVTRVFRWVSQPFDRPQFLLGSFSFDGWWYYYPVALLLKTPITSLLLITGSLVCLAVPHPRRSREGGTPTALWRSDAWALLLFVAIFLCLACTSTLALGLRYVLPVYPFLYVLVAYAASHAVSSARRWRGALVGG